MNKRICKNCSFYSEVGSQCRRYPPALDGNCSNFPEVIGEEEWCGEFEDKEEVEKKRFIY